jgi:hypothetical protein
MAGAPTTMWATLASPNSAYGSVPYVSIDGQTINTDVLHFSYIDGNAVSLTANLLSYQHSIYNGIRVSYSDNTAVPAVSTTINKVAGRLKIPAGQSTVTVVDNCCFAQSIVLLQLEGQDATLTRASVTPGNGQFTITGNANATANLQVSFLITNVGM